MFEAIHEQTGVAWKSWKIWDAFQKPHEEKWICCKLHKYPVTPVKEHKRKEQFVQAHFRSLTDHYCPGESDEHWNLKIQIAESIKNKQLLLSFRKEDIPYEIDETIPLDKYIEIRKKNRQADVFYQTKNYNSLLGNGLVIEIQVSEKIDSLESKAIDWIRNKYSITWVDKYPDNGILEIKYPMGLYYDIIRECNGLKWNKNKKKRRFSSW